MSLMMSFMLSFFLLNVLDVLDEICDFIESVSEVFPSYFCFTDQSTAIPVFVVQKFNTFFWRYMYLHIYRIGN